jgi:hypothetical protein
MSVLGSLLPRTRFIVSSVAAAFLVLPGPAAAQPQPFFPATPEHIQPRWTIESMGAWGGPVNAFEKHGDVGFIGSGQRLVTLDMSDLTDIRELGAVKLGSPVMDLRVRDGLVYVVTQGVRGSDAEPRRSAFHVVDAADPARPELIWSDPDTSLFGFSRSQGLAIDGLYSDFMFLRGESSGVRDWVADLTDPRNPVMVDDGLALLRSPGGSSVGINDMVIHGDLAFVATTETAGRLRIFDLSTINPGVWPMQPLHIGSVSFPLNHFSFRVAVDDGWAYVAVKDTVAEREVLWAVDVSDPASPVKHGSFDGFVQYSTGFLGFNIYELAVEGGRLYAANGARGAGARFWDESLGLATFDIATDPGQPALIATYKTHGSVRGVSAEGDTVYLRDWGEGLIVMDAADLADPARLGNYHSPAEPGVMERVGDLLYVSDAWNGLSILDVSDLSNPVLLGVYQTTERLGLGVSGLALLDGYIHLAAGQAGLEVIDVSDPANPIFRGAFRLPPSLACSRTVGRPSAVDDLPGFPGNVVYMPVAESACTGFAWGKVYSIDVTNPALPTQLDPTPPGTAFVNTFARASAPGRFFAANGVDPALLLDGSDPINLRIDEIAGQPSNRVASVSFDPDAGRLYLARRPFTGSEIAVTDMDSDWAGTEVNALDTFQVGDVASHPGGLIFIGRNIAGADPGPRVALVDMNPPLPPRVLASASIGFQDLGSSGLINRVLASDDAIFVTNGGPVGLVGLETFRLRRVVAFEQIGRVQP